MSAFFVGAGPGLANEIAETGDEEVESQDMYSLSKIHQRNR